MERTQRNSRESVADPHLLPWAAPDDPGIGRTMWPQANRKFWRNTQGCAEEVKAQKWQLGGDSVCPGGSRCKSDVAWGSAVRVTQRSCSSRPESHSLLLLSGRVLSRRTPGKEPSRAGC